MVALADKQPYNDCPSAKLIPGLNNTEETVIHKAGAPYIFSSVTMEGKPLPFTGTNPTLLVEEKWERSAVNDCSSLPVLQILKKQ